MVVGPETVVVVDFVEPLVVVVVVFVSVLTAFVSSLDYGLTKAILAIFG